MAVFHYVSVDEQGKKHKGVLEGDSINHVRQQLREKHWLPLEVVPASEKKIAKASLPFFPRKRIGAGTLALITYQFSTLLSAGMPVEAALANLAEQMGNTPLKTILLGVRAKVLEGHTLASGMDGFPHIFPRLYRATISAGEKSGQLDTVLARLSHYIEQQQHIKQKVQQALIYPSLLTLVSIAIVLFLLTYAMPRITSVFQQSGWTLPMLTRVLINFSQAVRDYGLYFFLGLIVILFLFFRLLKQSDFRFKFQKIILILPLIGSTLKILNASRFSRTFGILFESGVPVLEAMRAANNTVSLLPMQKAIETAIVQISEGSNIHRALQATGYFSLIGTQLIASGENTGMLEKMLEKAAEYQEQMVSNRLATALTLFEPFLILVMGMLVLFIVLAVLLPIFEINELIRF